MNTFRSAFIFCLTLGLLLIFGSLKLSHGAQQEISGSVQEMMSPEEFRAAGLNKLSPGELQKLDAWLQGYRQAAEKKATSRAERTKLDLLVSRVDGSFDGLTGRTVIRLEDGTVWKQANPDDAQFGDAACGVQAFRAHFAHHRHQNFSGILQFVLVNRE